MATVPGGMESESDSDCDMVFSTKADDSNKRKNYNSPRNSQSDKNSQIQLNCDRGREIRVDKVREIRENKNMMIPSSVIKNNYRNTAHSRHRAHKNKTLVFDDLRYAIVRGDTEATKNLYESNGIQTDTILKSDWTGLMFACSVGHADIVEYLLQRKADPNFHQDMFTPLMAVCISKKDEDNLLKCCSLLLQYGANVNVYERHHTTPLMFAAREGHTDIVKLLLQHGAECNTADSRGNTALAWASFFGHGQIVRVLLENGADRKKANNMGQLPADIAYDRGHTEVASILQKIQTINDEDEKSLKDLTESLPNNNKKSIFDSKIARNANSANKFNKVGELEIFLMGIDCQDLLDKFSEHHLGFHDLLIMDDSDLEKIGIFQLGLRKKILEACQAVHKKEWQNSSLPNLKRNHYITCPDAVSMVGNISKHLKYISTSVVYIRNQIQSQPRILELSKEGANIHNLMDEVEDSLKNILSLKDEMRFLKMHLEKVQNKPEYTCNDLVAETMSKDGSNKKVVVAIGIATVSVVLATVWLRYPGVFNNLQPTIYIRIPFLK